MAFVESCIPEQKLSQGTSFPRVFVPGSDDGNDLVKAITMDKQSITDALFQSCAILFRGFNVNSVSDFEAIVEALQYELHEFSGGAWLATSAPSAKVRQPDIPASLPLDYHNEGAYLKNPPSKMMLYCDVEPAAGQGATALLQGHILYEEMKRQEPEFVQELIEKKIIYSRSLNVNYQESMFGTSDKQELNKRAAILDSRIDWLEPEGAAVWHSNPREGVIEDETRGGRTVWFNALAAMQNSLSGLGSLAPTYGDGSALPADAMKTCRMLMKRHEVAIPWKKGDVLLIDNMAVMHSKRECDGKRAIFTALAA